MNDINLVTVTCGRDCGIQLLQSYSMDLMLNDPCVHYVIVEDDTVSIEEWHTLLSPYYTRHQLNLISGREFIDSKYYLNDSSIKNGWHRSAVLKLLIADKIKTKKYLIFDSKNFFTHKQSLNDWPIEDGNGLVEPYNSRGWKEVDEFCEQHNIKVTDTVYHSTTPFIVDTAVVKEILKFDLLSLFFDKKGWWSSELFLYSIFTQHVGNKLQEHPVPNVTFWDTERKMTLEQLTDIYNWPNMRAMGLHRKVIKNGTDLTAFVEFLINLGFNENIVKTLLWRYTQDITNWNNGE